MEQFKDPARTPATYKRLRSISRVCGGLIILIGLLVLIGWLLDIEFLKSVRQGAVPMNPVTAITFIFAGIALILLQEGTTPKKQKVALWLIGFIGLVGFLKLFSIITHLPIPYDHVLFRGKLWNPERQEFDSVAPNTAVNFILTAVALYLVDYATERGRRPSQYLGIIITLYSLVSLYGYIYDIGALYSFTTYIPMAVHTAFSFLLLGAGILFTRPDKGPMSIVIGENSGQIIFMRFVALLLPLVFGWFRLQGEKAGYFEPEIGTALFAVLTYAIAMFLLGRQSYLQYQIRKTKQQAMDAIKENERRLQAILDNSATNISLKTLIGRYTLVNKQFEKDFGIENETALGKTDYDLFTRELAKELNQYDHEIIRTGAPKSFEEKYPQKDGLHTYITVKFPLFNQNRKIYALGAVSTDITKRKHLEEELRKSHQRLFGILDNVGEGVVVADKDGNFIIFNKRAEEILGVGSINVGWEEWTQTYGVFLPDGQTYFPESEMPLYQALHGESADNVEMYIKNEKFPFGRWIAVTGRPVMNDKQNEIIAGVIVFRDITARKQLEKLFVENEKRLKEILASIGEGIIILNQDEHVLLFNRKAEEILGTGPKDLNLTKWPEFYGLYEPTGTTLIPAHDLPMVKALQGEPAEKVEIMIRNKNVPEGKHIFIAGRPIKDSKGAINGCIVDFRDITEQRKLEEYVQEIQDQFQELVKLHQS